MSEARVKLAKIVALGLENVTENQIADSKENLDWFSTNQLSLCSRYSGKYVLMENKKFFLRLKQLEK